MIDSTTKSNLHKHYRFRDPYWNKNDQTSEIQSFKTPKNVELNENNLCKWLKWMSWSNCLPLTLNTENSNKGERTRSRICPCM